MAGTAFSAANWSGFDEQSVTNPTSELTAFTLIIDVSTFSVDWKSAVQSDAGDIRLTKGDGTTELAYDLIDWSYNAGSPTGWIRVLWIGSLANSGTQNVRCYAGYNPGTAVAYDVDETFGQDNAYDANWLMYWPLFEDPSGSSPQAQDRTSNGFHGTSAGTMLSEDVVAGQVGSAWDFDGSDDTVVNAAVVLGANSQVTVLAWAEWSDGSNDAIIASDSGAEFGLRNAAGELQFLLNSFSSNDRVTGATSPIGGVVHHLGGRFDGTDLDVFLDGVSDASLTPTGSWAGQTGLMVGDFPATGGAEWGGWIDDVQVHDTGRSDDWIAEEYDQTNSQATFWGTWGWTAAPVAGGDSIPYLLKQRTQRFQPLIVR